MKSSVIDLSYLRTSRRASPVAHYNLAGVYLGAYPSVAKAAAILNTTSAAITEASKTGNRSGNYRFSIADKDGNVPFRLANGTTTKTAAPTTTATSTSTQPTSGGVTRTTGGLKVKKQPVIQYRNGARVNRFESLSAAARAVGGSPSNISEAARRVTDSKGARRSTAYGYTWRFETEADRAISTSTSSSTTTANPIWTGCGGQRKAA